MGHLQGETTSITYKTRIKIKLCSQHRVCHDISKSIAENGNVKCISYEVDLAL